MPDADVLERALSALGFVDVKVETRTLGVAFEGGLDHAAAALTATPLGPALAALPDERRAAFATAARRRLAPFLDPGDGVVTGEMTCNVAIGRRPG
jgi:hypothetical protein